MPDPSPSIRPSRVLVTGVGGNLGRKLVAHLVAAPWCATVVALDLDAVAFGHPKVSAVAVDLRIGWCQPGDNRPGTMTASGIPGVPGPDTPEALRRLRWFRGMWLSNRDFRLGRAEGSHGNKCCYFRASALLDDLRFRSTCSRG